MKWDHANLVNQLARLVNLIIIMRVHKSPHILLNLFHTTLPLGASISYLIRLKQWASNSKNHRHG
jgi:hypothetical protein